jgi:hypothetical protein
MSNSYDEEDSRSTLPVFGKALLENQVLTGFASQSWAGIHPAAEEFKKEIAAQMGGSQPSPSDLVDGFATVAKALIGEPSGLYKSPVSKYSSLASLPGLGGFITMIQVVISVSDAGEERLSDPFLVVTGPPVVPLQSSSEASVFPRAEIGLEGISLAPSEATWPNERLYPLVFPLNARRGLGVHST